MERRWWVSLSIGYAAGIFVLSSFPLPDSPFLSAHGLDKLIHAAEYAVFFLLLRRASSGRAWIALLIAVLYAGSDELHQAFVPGRHAGFDDFSADLAGIALMAVLLAVLRRSPLPGRIGRRILESVISRKED